MSKSPRLRASARTSSFLFPSPISRLIGSAFAIQYLFEERSFAFWAINAGYHLVQFTIIALVIGLWP